MDFLSRLWYYLSTMPYTDLRFLHASHVPLCDARVSKHFDGYHTLQFGEEGGVEVLYDAQRHALQGSGWFWTAFPGPFIRFHALPGQRAWNHRYAAFTGPRVARWIAEGLWSSEPQRTGQTTLCAARFDEMLAHIQTGGPFRAARAINVLESLLLLLAEERAQAPQTAAPEPWLGDILTAISAENMPPDYASLAAQHGIALSTLRRRFKQATGIALHEYALQTRIARARTLLGETDTPIKAIAEGLGYSDVYFFTRQFRQSVGVPPAAFRRSRQS